MVRIPQHDTASIQAMYGPSIAARVSEDRAKERERQVQHEITAAALRGMSRADRMRWWPKMRASR